MEDDAFAQAVALLAEYGRGGVAQVIIDGIKRRKPGLPRRSYDDFWRLATREDATGSGAEGYGRHINMTACFNGFAYTLGHEMTLELAVALQKASGSLRE